ncbi:hypothetical protein E4U41_004327 [Claviceps citrina]|nr:hypothetical protein E4U41_004327 [Claviceps citrina]
MGHDAAPHEGMSAATYLATRLSSLRPPMRPVPNPWRLVRMLNTQQWMFFALAFSAWTWDSFDFFTVSLTVNDLAREFGKTPTDITWGITLVLMFRSVGAILFGIASDRWGRKWPFVVNNALFVVLELGTGFCSTYAQFLACRAMFGIAMGGLYGNAAATALEDVPEEARGLMSGILQQGYAFGYLLCAAFARGLVDTTKSQWRPLYWFAACPPVFFIGVRLLLPETNAFQERLRERERQHQLQRQLGDEDEAASPGHDVGKKSAAATAPAGAAAGSVFLRQGRLALQRHWLLLGHLVLLMAGFNFISHGSQDLYPTMLENELRFTKTEVTLTQVLANLGAMAGGTLVGFLSQSFGRRLSILACCVLGGALLYPYGRRIGPSGTGDGTGGPDGSIMAAAFFQQFCAQGAWGVVPIHLMELSPGAFRTFVVGTAYQLGNLVSSASSTIEARLAEQFPLPPAGTGADHRYDYGKVICIFMGCAYAYTLLLTLAGPEHLGRRFDTAGHHHHHDRGDDAPESVGASAETAHDDKPGRGNRHGGSDDETAAAEYRE